MSSLSSVVSNLVRASMGTSLSSTITDEDLDRHVAELILKEAKQKAERYGKEGMRAYLPQIADSNAPKTNKRFLSSIIRSTDDHNKTILRAQALAAQEVRLLREEQERRERKARAEEATEAERMRRLMGGGRTDWAHNWDRSERRDRKRRERSRERDSLDADRGEGSSRRSEKRERRHRHRSRSGDRRSRREEDTRSRRSRSPERRDRAVEETEDRSRHRRDKRRSRSVDEDDRSDRHRRKRRRYSKDRSHTRRHITRSPSVDRYSRSRSRSQDSVRTVKSHRRNSGQSPSLRGFLSAQFDEQDKIVDTLSREDELKLQLKHKGRAESRIDNPSGTSRSPSLPIDRERKRKSPLPPSKAGSSSSHTLRSCYSRSRSRSRSASPNPSSPPRHPPSKMDKYFESSYDPRLDVAPLSVPTIPSTGLISDAEFEGWDAMLEIIRLRRQDKEDRKALERWDLGKDKSKDKKRKKSDEGEPERVSEGGLGIMDIEYKKRGSVREWDLGKEGF